MYIAIAGNIGSGKTTLTRLLTERLRARAYYEEEQNPYIGDFYEDMNRWSFNLQIFFLGSRIRQTLSILAHKEGDIIQDRTIYEDAHIFADNLHGMGLLSGRDFDTYMSVFNLMQELVPTPDLLIYLRASVPKLVEQIHRRGRSYEQNIDAAYLERLGERYDHWVDELYPGRVLTVDMDKEDFLENPAAFEAIFKEVESVRAAR